MKRIFLLLVFILFATTSFASPFSDVPKDHWAFEAIDSLVSKGIFETYPDGEFKGEKVVSRYHLAMVIAKMLASVEQKKGQVSRADLKVIEKLTIEFADELALMSINIKSLQNDLADVKENVSGLKKEINDIKNFIKNGGNDNVKISGDIVVRNYDFKQNNGAHNNRTESMFRIKLDAKVTEKISAHVRWNLIQDNNDRAVPFATNEWNGGNKNTGDVEIANLEFKDLFKTGDKLKVGRDWYTHGHGIVIHDYVDAVSYSKKCGYVDLAFNCFFDRNNSITAKDYLNVWNINFDYIHKNHKLYLGFYYNSRDYQFNNLGNRLAVNKNKKDIKVEFGASGNIGKPKNGLTYDLAGVYNESKGFVRWPSGSEADLKGWLSYVAVNYDKKKDLNLKLAYAYADEESNAAIRRNDFNSYVMAEETPFEDLSYLLVNGIITNIKDAKIQVGYTLRKANKHSFRFAYDKIQEKNSRAFRTDTNLFTAEYRYKLSDNSRFRVVYQNAKDDEGYFTLRGESRKILFTEIYARF